MATRQPRNSATDLLAQLAERPEAAGDIRDAQVEADQIETAARITTKELRGTDTYQKKILPFSEFRSRSDQELPFHERTTSENRPSEFTTKQIKIIDIEAEPEACDDCAGQGTNECTECSGESLLPCPNSECTDGDVRCENCDGTAQIECPTCNGNGDLGCGPCNSTGSRTCGKCRGDGSVTCQTCKSGFLSARPAGKLACSDCNGTGTKQATNGEVTCPTCDGGYRTCHECNGTKSVPCTNCGRAGSFTCASCNGAGKNPCQNCVRTGIVTCDQCDDGNQICSVCDGETTVPCGCGDGRVTCEICAGDGETVLTRVGRVSYRVNESTTIESDLGVGEAHFQKGRIANEETTLEIEHGDFSDQGNWIERKQVRREEIPVRKVTYRYNQARYSILDVGGHVIFGEYPESETLTDFKSTLTDRRRQLRKETAKRRDFFRESAEVRTDQIQDYSERVSGYRVALRYGFYCLSLIALYGMYLFISH